MWQKVILLCIENVIKNLKLSYFKAIELKLKVLLNKDLH